MILYVRFVVTAENQRTADERIPILLQIPAAVRFVSVEPMLEGITLNYLHYEVGAVEIDCLNGTHGVIRPHMGKNSNIDWVIIGAESGAKKRYCGIEWIQNLKNECMRANIPLFIKQIHLKQKNGFVLKKHLEDFPEDMRIREFPKLKEE